MQTTEQAEATADDIAERLTRKANAYAEAGILLPPEFRPMDGVFHPKAVWILVLLERELAETDVNALDTEALTEVRGHRSELEKALLGRTLDTSDHSWRLSEGAANPLPQLEEALTRDDLLRLLERFPQEDVNLLYAYYTDEYDDRDALAQHRKRLAEQMGVSYDALRQTITRLVGSLREKFTN